ncbi:MAG: YeeE/YedE family protein [Flavobacterium sp.]|nr:YeeE/YedE family protein [Flavobacterium sp.]
MEFISQTWHWSISGFIIGMVMLFLIYFGKVFGMSSNLRSLCAMTGIGTKIPFFNWDWKSQRWNLIVVIGAMIGGYVANTFLHSTENVQLNPETLKKLSKFKIDLPNGKLLPDFMFGNQIFHSPKMILFLTIGGLLIGFGSRYAGGCTSGHAISGLSNFQSPSLKAVIGFFIGGLIMAHFIFPLLF